MKIYDKAAWHIDNGEDAKEVINKFDIILSYLSAHDMLSDAGKEILGLGIDSSISINSGMLTKAGADFMDRHYDNLLACDSTSIKNALATL